MISISSQISGRFGSDDYSVEGPSVGGWLAFEKNWPLYFESTAGVKALIGLITLISRCK